MSMNAITLKLAMMEALENSRGRRSKREQTTTNTDNHTCTRLNLNVDGKGSSEQTQKKIDLQALRQKYNHMDLGRRAAPRYSVRVSVLAFNNHDSFRTESVNLSESGVLLKDLLPKSFMDGAFDLVMLVRHPETNETHRLMFKAKAVGGPLRSGRVSFNSSAGQTAELLQSLLADLTPHLF